MKKKKQTSYKGKVIALLLLFPVTVILYIFVGLYWVKYIDNQSFPIVQEMVAEKKHVKQKELQIPKDYIPIYKEAAAKYDIPWTLLAAVHRVETRFSTMKADVSPVGAEGPMQFMPCTFTGWKHPSCKGKGEGKIPAEQKTSIQTIKKFGGYGVDGNGDGVADPFQIEDAIFSAANYLSKNGAAQNDIKSALFLYNRSDQYVNDVYGYYETYEKKNRSFK